MSIGAQLYDPIGGGISAIGTGPIAGDPEPCIRVNSTNYLSTGELSPGESGDVGGLFDGLTVELWYLPSSFPSVSVDAIVNGPNTTTGRQWGLAIETSGAITLFVRDSVGTLTQVSSPSPITVGQWTYLAGTFGGGVARLYINGVQVNTGTGGGPFNPVLSSPADLRIGDTTTEIGYCQYSDLAVYRAPLSAARILAHYVAGTQRGWGAELSGSRIRDVLALSSSRNAPLNIGAGVRLVQDTYMTGQAPLDEIRSAVSGDSVDAAFFTADDGTLTYLAADHRASSPYNTVQVTFDDDGTDIGYTDLTLDLSDSFLNNEWNVTRLGTSNVGGITQTASDTTSISRFYKRSNSISGIPVTSDADSLTIGTAMLAKYKDPFTRITSISFTTADPAISEAIFRRELMDRIRVFRTAPGGGSRIDQTLFIQKIDVTGANDGAPWSVRWGVSPL